MAVNTRSAPHRDLRFASLDELDAELARIEAAHRAGTLETTGNWSAAQILRHLADFWRLSFDGFGFKAPWILRVIVKPFKSKLLRSKPPRGIRNRGAIRIVEPPAQADFAECIASLRKQIARTRAGEKMTCPSPLFGKVSHEQWLAMHLNHSAMHLGFTRYPGAPNA